MKAEMQTVTCVKGEPRTTSLCLAAGTKSKHEAVIKLVRKYSEDLKEFGPLGFEIHVVNRKQGGGTPCEYATLNEQQATLILSYMRNNDVVRRFKINLVKEFYRMKQALLNRQNLSWQQQRLDGKSARRIETNTIAAFVDYATAQGSRQSKMYYMQITKMTHQALFLVKQASPKPFRDMLDSMQLSFLTTAEYLIQQALDDGMASALHYKEIYALARQRVEHYAAQLPMQRLLVVGGN
jgi:phage regulator Rha-like protein